MQLFDTAVLLLTIALIICLSASRKMTRWITGLCLSLFICLFVHALSEGFRWQMVPAYIVVALALVLAAVKLRQREQTTTKSRLKRIGSWSGVFLAILMLALTTLLSYAFPVFDIPAPTGKYAVGTMELHLIDDSRAEDYTANPNDHRELMVRIWYPAKFAADSDRSMYWREPVTRSSAVTENTPLPWFVFSHLGLVPTHSYWHAPVASREPSYPVVLYSHGIGLGWASGNTKLVEGLASHGYVVVGIDHAYIGSISIFPNGRLAKFDELTARAMNEPPSQKILHLRTQLQTSEDWREHIELYSQGMELMPNALTKVSQALSTQVLDQRFVISHLKHLQRNVTLPATTNLDLKRIGLLGMSLGGSAALETCSIDFRCKAGVNLDGFHPRHIGLALRATPFLFLNRKDNLLYNSNFQSSRSPVYSALISSITHFNFFDFSIMSPLYKQLGVLGSIDGYRMLDLTEDYVVAFFDKHLKGQDDADLSALSEKYPEVRFTQRNTN